MFLCYPCNEEVDIISGKEITQHLRFHEVRDGLKYPLSCLQPNYKSGSFAAINSLVKHFNQFHSDEFKIVPSKKRMLASSLLPIGEKNPPSPPNEDNPCPKRNINYNIRDEVLALLSSLWANSSVPHSVILEVAKTCNNIERIATDRALNIVCDSLSEIENGAEICTDKRSKIEAALTPTKIPHTTYDIGQHFENHHLFIKPKTVFLGNRFEHRINNGQSVDMLVQDTFEYISVKKTL